MKGRYTGRWQCMYGFCDGDDRDDVIRRTEEQSRFNLAGSTWWVTDPAGKVIANGFAPGQPNAITNV